MFIHAFLHIQQIIKKSEQAMLCALLLSKSHAGSALLLFEMVDFVHAQGA